METHGLTKATVHLVEEDFLCKKFSIVVDEVKHLLSTQHQTAFSSSKEFTGKHDCNKDCLCQYIISCAVQALHLEGKMLEAFYLVASHYVYHGVPPRLALLFLRTLEISDESDSHDSHKAKKYMKIWPEILQLVQHSIIRGLKDFNLPHSNVTDDSTPWLSDGEQETLFPLVESWHALNLPGQAHSGNLCPKDLALIKSSLANKVEGSDEQANLGVLVEKCVREVKVQGKHHFDSLKNHARTASSGSAVDKQGEVKEPSSSSSPPPEAVSSDSKPTANNNHHPHSKRRTTKAKTAKAGSTTKSNGVESRGSRRKSKQRRRDASVGAGAGAGLLAWVRRTWRRGGQAARNAAALVTLLCFYYFMRRVMRLSQPPARRASALVNRAKNIYS